ncbi:MAG TPA: response regulator transcription factor [Alphaproteobacteria bacterium]|nr:response regulator transcription factor [Alphaproteobacteria bacterium]
MKVLIADDHALFRQGLTQFMSSRFEKLSVTEAGSFYDVMALNARLADFDLILLDLSMPGIDGFAGVAMVRAHAPRVPLVIISASERQEDVVRALDLGVTAYISKSMTGRELLDGLAIVLSGNTYLPAALMRAAPAQTDHKLAGSREPLRQLSRRQSEVLLLLCEGRSNREIADALQLAEQTVKMHVSNILRLLGARSRTEAVVRLGELGYPVGIRRR